MANLKLKKGDQVKVITGAHKGKTGKIVAVLPKENAVKVEGINVVRRHVKPNMLQPQGGIVDKHIAIDASKVAILQTGKKDAISRIGFTTKKDGSKVRVFKTTNKEIDV
jgi:large subunit ribosomal protein L24